MKNKAFIYALVVLAPAVLHAQKTPTQSSQPNVQSDRQYQQNLGRQGQHAYDAMEQNERQFRTDSLGNLTKLRGKLAEAWQTLGMSPQQAQVVAAAYQPDFADNIHHRASLRGKSETQMAAMLQSSLTAKNYILANQLLIDYQREQLKLGTPAFPEGRY